MSIRNWIATTKLLKKRLNNPRETLFPKVSDVINIKQFQAMADAFDLIILLYEAEQTQTLKATLAKHDYKKIAIIVGPEGGFEPEEVEAFKAMGAVSVRLGKRIMRTETAGFVTVANLQYEIGDLNCL